MDESWKCIPNLSAHRNPNNSLDGDIGEFLARPFVYPSYNLIPDVPAPTTNVFPAPTTNVFPASQTVLLTPQENSSSHPASNMACLSQHQLGLSMAVQSEVSARQRTATPCENNVQNNISSSFRSDRRSQRMIKNRESAARSRKRKEAYIAQLEVQLESLKAENAELKRELQSREAAPALMKPALKRSASSLF